MRLSTHSLKLAMLPLAAITAFSMVVVACGGDDDNGDDGGSSTPAATQPASGATEPAGETPVATQPATGGVTTIVTKDPGNGSGAILTTVDGYTLYVFDNDTAGSGTSACEGGCASAWPPLPVADPTGSSEVTGELDSITRADGSPQSTYNGKPLYMYSGDASPGDLNGDGVGGVWHVARP